MEFTKQEKEVILALLEKELKTMESKEEVMNKLHAVPIDPNFRAAEEKYEYVLEQIIKKIK